MALGGRPRGACCLRQARTRQPCSTNALQVGCLAVGAACHSHARWPGTPGGAGCGAKREPRRSRNRLVLASSRTALLHGTCYPKPYCPEKATLRSITSAMLPHYTVSPHNPRARRFFLSSNMSYCSDPVACTYQWSLTCPNAVRSMGGEAPLHAGPWKLRPQIHNLPSLYVYPYTHPTLDTVQSPTAVPKPTCSPPPAPPRLAPCPHARRRRSSPRARHKPIWQARLARGRSTQRGSSATWCAPHAHWSLRQMAPSGCNRKIQTHPLPKQRVALGLRSLVGRQHACATPKLTRPSAMLALLHPAGLHSRAQFHRQ